MIGNDDDRIAFGKSTNDWQRPLSSAEVRVGHGLFDDTEDDRIDSDGNPLDASEDEEFADEVSDVSDDDLRVAEDKWDA